MSKPCPIYGKAIYADCLECDERLCANGSKNKNKNKIVIGIDQSYADTGITVGINGIIKKISDCNTSKLETNSEARLCLKNKLDKVFSAMQSKSFEYSNCVVICLIERIRLQSQGFVNISYIKSIGALNAMIVDKAKEYDIEVYSVDTRAWKSAVIGTSKGKPNKYGVDPKKWPTILWLVKQGYEDDIKDMVSKRKTKGVFIKNGERFIYNDNKADSACICLYGFVPESKQLLQLEH